MLWLKSAIAAILLFFGTLFGLTHPPAAVLHLSASSTPSGESAAPSTSSTLAIPGGEPVPQNATSTDHVLAIATAPNSAEAVLRDDGTYETLSYLAPKGGPPKMLIQLFVADVKRSSMNPGTLKISSTGKYVLVDIIGGGDETSSAIIDTSSNDYSNDGDGDTSLPYIFSLPDIKEVLWAPDDSWFAMTAEDSDSDANLDDEAVYVYYPGKTYTCAPNAGNLPAELLANDEAPNLCLITVIGNPEIHDSRYPEAVDAYFDFRNLRLVGGKIQFGKVKAPFGFNDAKPALQVLATYAYDLKTGSLQVTP